MTCDHGRSVAVVLQLGLSTPNRVITRLLGVSYARVILPTFAVTSARL